jgi:hypothetical protein
MRAVATDIHLLISFPVCSYHRVCEADDVIPTTIPRQHGPDHRRPLCRRWANCCINPIGFGCAATPAITV